MRSRVFETAEEAVDKVAAPVGRSVERIGHSPAGCGGDDGADAAQLEPAAQAFGAISLVGDQPPGRRDGADERHRHGDVGDVARCQRERDRSAAIIGQAMDL